MGFHIDGASEWREGRNKFGQFKSIRRKTKGKSELAKINVFSTFRLNFKDDQNEFEKFGFQRL